MQCDIWALGFLCGMDAPAQHKACSELMSCTSVPAVSIDSIQEVCEGKQSEIFQRYADGSFDPNCCFSIYYGDHMESLDLVSSSAEEARTWITGLKYLMAGISDEDSLSKRQRTRDQYPSCAARGFPSSAELGMSSGFLTVFVLLQVSTGFKAVPIAFPVSRDRTSGQNLEMSDCKTHRHILQSHSLCKTIHLIW